MKNVTVVAIGFRLVISDLSAFLSLFGIFSGSLSSLLVLVP